MNHLRLKCRLKTGLLIILLTVFSLATVGLAQPIRQLTINYIEVSEAPDKYANQVSAYVTVTDKDENPIADLAIQDFEVNEDGKEIGEEQNLAVSQTADPMAVILAIDTSGSMQARDRSGLTSMEAAKQAAIDFIEMLSQDDRVAIFSFNNDPTLDLDFTVDHQAAVNAVNQLSAKYRASTCLYDTAIEAIKKAAEIPKGRRAIILLTDGKDEKGGGACSIHTSSDVIDAATTKAIRVPIYTIGVGPKVDSTELRRFASFTGGRNLLATSVAELKGFYQKIAKQLKNQYSVTYLTRSPSGEHSLVIKARREGSVEQDLKRFLSPPPPISAEPKVNFLSPTENDKIAGTVDVRLHITPEEGIIKVRYYADSVLKKEYDSPPFKTFRWDTADLSPGLHVLRAEAFNVIGQMGWAELTLKINAPAVEITSPSPSAEIHGNVEVEIRIISEEELAKLRYFVDSVQIEEFVTGDFEAFNLNAANLSAGPHTLRVEVEDVNGRYGFAEIPVRIKTPAAGGLLTIVLTVVLILFIAILAGGGIWWMRIRKMEAETLSAKYTKEAHPPDEYEALEDETMLLTDAGAGKPAPRATLTVVQAPEIKPGVAYPIVGNTRIGRSENNEIHFPEKSVSRKHAEIYFDGSFFYLRDLGSKYGTMIDQKRVSSEVAKLQNGTRIELGPKVAFEFHCEDKPEDFEVETPELPSDAIETATEEPVEYEATIEFRKDGDVLPEKDVDVEAADQPALAEKPSNKQDKAEEKTIEADALENGLIAKIKEEAAKIVPKAGDEAFTPIVEEEEGDKTIRNADLEDDVSTKKRKADAASEISEMDDADATMKIDSGNE